LATDSPHNGLEPSNILAMLGAHQQKKEIAKIATSFFISQPIKLKNYFIVDLKH